MGWFLRWQRMDPTRGRAGCARGHASLPRQADTPGISARRKCTRCGTAVAALGGDGWSVREGKRVLTGDEHILVLRQPWRGHDDVDRRNLRRRREARHRHGAAGADALTEVALGVVVLR